MSCELRTPTLANGLRERAAERLYERRDIETELACVSGQTQPVLVPPVILRTVVDGERREYTFSVECRGRESRKTYRIRSEYPAVVRSEIVHEAIIAATAGKIKGAGTFVVLGSSN